jgi:diguanylate cyclase (GGDEF)-like protein/PAS domain S-box-containing protein
MPFEQDDAADPIERGVSELVNAVRRGNYFDAIRCVEAIAALHKDHARADIVAHWRERARRLREGLPAAGAQTDPPQFVDYGGLFNALLARAYDSIVISSAQDGWMLECSESFVALTGYSREELLGRTSLELQLIDPDIRAAALDAAFRQGSAGGFETPLRCKDGHVRLVEFSPQPVGAGEFLVTIVRDVTERRQFEARIRELADRDPLTGLYNRRRFLEEFDRVASERRRFEESAVLLLLDLDDFKSINDGHGHHFGDRALLVLARALQESVRTTDIVARLGGDEFVVLLTRTDQEATDRVINAIVGRLGASPLTSPAGPVYIRASFGAATLVGDADFDETVHRADEQMYANKRASRA